MCSRSQREAATCHAHPQRLSPSRRGEAKVAVCSQHGASHRLISQSPQTRSCPSQWDTRAQRQRLGKPRPPLTFRSSSPVSPTALCMHAAYAMRSSVHVSVHYAHVPWCRGWPQTCVLTLAGWLYGDGEDPAAAQPPKPADDGFGQAVSDFITEDHAELPGAIPGEAIRAHKGVLKHKVELDVPAPAQLSLADTQALRKEDEDAKKKKRPVPASYVIHFPSLNTGQWEDVVHSVMWRVGRYFGFQAFNLNPKTRNNMVRGLPAHTGCTCGWAPHTACLLDTVHQAVNFQHAMCSPPASLCSTLRSMASGCQAPSSAPATTWSTLWFATPTSAETWAPTSRRNALRRCVGQQQQQPWAGAQWSMRMLHC